MSERFIVAALYHFVRIENPEALQQELKDLLLANQIRGTLLVAQEGINGTIAGSRAGLQSVLSRLRQDPRFSAVNVKESEADKMPFKRTRVKLKKEIVTMGIEDIDPNHIVGSYVNPADWNALIEDPEVTVIDTRNEYEINIGTFRHAINPHTSSFRQFPEFARNTLDVTKNKKVAMFCTGGIRCEKSTALLKSQGFEQVYHLKGGILKYLEDVPTAESLWQGECFVFDDRVTVDHELKPGTYDQCHACRMPITQADKTHDAYVRGISCHHCIDTNSAQQRARFAEREKQLQLAAERGESHIGADAINTQRTNRAQKKQKKENQRSRRNA